MSYKQLKWLILLVPTITVGLWEYIRHEYLLPYISMDTGNWLTPFIVIIVTFTLLTRFFTKMEKIQEDLNKERAEKAVLEERERIARDLHDGMAQSLFLLSIKIRQLKEIDIPEKDRKIFENLKNNIEEIHDYVRKGIKQLKMPIDLLDMPWKEGINKLTTEFHEDTGIPIHTRITIDETLITDEEKAELTVCISEALMNIRKHAHATRINFEIQITPKNKLIIIKDNGKGFTNKDLQKPNSYGLRMLQDRCKRINWSIKISRERGKTILTLIK